MGRIARLRSVAACLSSETAIAGLLATELLPVTLGTIALLRPAVALATISAGLLAVALRAIALRAIGLRAAIALLSTVPALALLPVALWPITALATLRSVALRTLRTVTALRSV